MEHASIGTLSLILLSLIVLSGFFSGSEIGMMALNRYRLKHLVKKKNRTAIRVQKLLNRTDRLLGIILIGNTAANIFATAIATIIAVRLWGDVGIAIVTAALTFIILIFAEIAPKTLAARHPQGFAFFASIPLSILLQILYPLVWVSNTCANGVLRIFGVKSNHQATEHLSAEELRTVVHEASGLIPDEHRTMLLSLMDLEKVTVDDIMVPQNEISGIDLNDDWNEILEQIINSQHTRVPVFTDSIDKVVGMVHLRKVLSLIADDDLDKEVLKEIADEIYFIPEGTLLNRQLLNFREAKVRSGLVVDEYGDIKGLVTLEDILEEVIGEFTTDFAALSKDIHPQPDGSYLVDGTVTIRDLNRGIGSKFPTSGPKTLGGLILEYIEQIPPVGTCMKYSEYIFEVVKLQDNMIKTVRVTPLSA